MDEETRRALERIRELVETTEWGADVRPRIDYIRGMIDALLADHAEPVRPAAGQLTLGEVR